MIEINANSLKWAYQKLKNYIYYTSPASYLKDRIINFEESLKEDTFVEMADDLCNIFSKNINMLSWQGISYLIYPKKDGVRGDNGQLTVDNFNVFIDMPIKFYLVDILFTLNLFENINETSECSFGNDFDNRLWEIKNGDRAGNILENKLLFANFHHQYSLWKDKIYNYLDGPAKNENKIIVKMDFTRSYYNVYFNINAFLTKHINDNINNPIYNFEKNLYRYYTKILDSLIPYNKAPINNYVHLPIGLFSSACIFNILLEDFDKQMEKICDVYARYVDDLLMVIPDDKEGSANIIEDKFGSVFSFLDNKYVVKTSFSNNSSYELNSRKIKFIYRRAGYPLNSLKAKINKIIKPSMDVVEEMDFHENDFDEYSMYKHDYLKSLIKSIDSREDEKYEQVRNLSDSDLINLYSCWKNLLELDSDCFKERIVGAISQVKIKNIFDGELLNAEKKLKTALRFEFNFANNKDKIYDKFLLCDIGQERIIEHIKKIDSKETDELYPLVTTFDDITFYYTRELSYIGEDLITNAISLYKQINGFGINKSCEIKESGKITLIGKQDHSGTYKGRVKIAVANMNFSIDDLKQTDIDGLFPKSYSLKIFKRLIKQAKYGGASIILFPEFSLPENCALEIAKYCRTIGISIITGLTHVKLKDKLANCVLIRDDELDITLLKWKNYFPKSEKEFCLSASYGYQEPQDPYYIVIDNGLYKYSTMTCYEATSIKDRALLCDQIEILFMPVFNKDTYYFSNIVSSFVRDASCFVAQSNANIYGDSRISGPFSHIFMDIVKLKGGLNNYFVIGEVDFDALRSQNVQYHKMDNKLYEASDNPSLFTSTKEGNNKSQYNKIKPLSAGKNRYNERRNNNLDCPLDNVWEGGDEEI